ncbi:MAG: sugar fermentation stimulation protein SfsA, partial [Armatimonadota bacterium]|nr:sugar fermentation stimulation protein SfsA [Armatimonadota bacterium]
MRFEPPLIPACFLSRENRFLVRVRTRGGVEAAHLPNSGRMTELLVPGAAAMLAPVRRAARKTAWDLVLIAYQGRWVSVDARLAPLLAAEALQRG